MVPSFVLFFSKAGKVSQEGEMAQWVEILALQAEDLSSDPQH